MTKKGFTFVELLVSVSIVAVLAAIGAVSYSSTTKRSRDAKREADIQTIRSALELYRSEVNNYPSLSVNGSGCLTATSIAYGGTTYLSPIPTDPKNNGTTYCYKYTRGASPYTTYTMSCTYESGAACSFANP